MNYPPRQSIALLSFLLLCSATASHAELDHRPPQPDNPEITLTSSIRFGSCCKHNRPQPLWNKVIESSPQLYIWLGDNIYADTEDMDEMRRKYGELASNKDYQKLVATCPVIATWDDHDYGDNDLGRDYPKKEESKEIFLNFFNEPAESARRKRKGIYTSYYFGPEGKRVQRYPHRHPPLPFTTQKRVKTTLPSHGQIPSRP